MTKRFSATPYLFLAPALILIAVFVLYPIGAVVYYSFTDWDIVRPPVWSASTTTSSSSPTRRSGRRSPTRSSTCWSRRRSSPCRSAWRSSSTASCAGIHIFRALYFVPAVSGSIAIGIAWRWLFDRNGFINSVLISLGAIKDPIQWLSEPGLVLPIAMLLTIWAGVGYYAVIFLAGLQNIPEELYDAARIDGCNDFQKHWHVSLPGLRPQIAFVAVISSLAALKVFDEIYVLTNRTGGILDSGRDDRLLPVEAGLRERQHAGYAAAIAMVLLAVTLAFSIVNVRFLERGTERLMAAIPPTPRPPPPAPVRAAARGRRSPDAERDVLVRRAGAHRRRVHLPVRVDPADLAQGPGRPAVLDAAADPAGPPDAGELRPRARRPADPEVLPQQHRRRRRTTVFNVLIAALAAYPLAKMRFRGREPIFYLLLATLIVPAQLTFIPSYLLARFFGYYDSLPAIIWPSLASAFNIFLLRQAFRGVPNELIDAARVDGARDWRIWWQIALPLVRPTVATVAIFTFVTSWNDFLWPSLMLPTMTNKTLPVGLAALQGFFASDFRGIAAGVTMTVVPILIFFIALQRHFVRGLSGAIKG